MSWAPGYARQAPAEPATREITVQVTARDLAEGKRHSFRDDPVSRALTRATGARGWGVGYNAAFLGRRPMGRFDAELERTLRDYDAGRPVAPFSFTMHVPEDW